MAISRRDVIPPWLPFLGVGFLTTFCFLWHNKYLGQNVGPFDRRPGPGKVGHKTAKTTPLVTPPQGNPKPKTEKFFFESELLDLLNP